jgi:type VI secretion system secreted protein Hcp
VASDIFAKIGDIKGESLDDKHKGQIEVLSWSWGLTNAGASPPGGGGGGGTGKATFHELSFTHKIDRASPVLMKGCATGQHIKEALLSGVRRSGKAQQDFLIIKMSDVLITAVMDGESVEGGLEHVTLAFAKIDLEYRPQKADGSLDAGIHFKYDLKAHKDG